MTVRATGKERSAFVAQSSDVRNGTGPFITEEDLLFQFFAGPVLPTHFCEASLDELFNVAVGGDLFISDREVSVLLRQTAEECVHERRIAMRNGQAGIFLVELQRVANLAVLFERHVLVINPAGTGLMTKRAVEFFPIEQSHSRIVANMCGVTEAKRVRVFVICRMELKIGMIF